MPGTRFNVSERFTCGLSSRMTRPSTASIEAGLSKPAWGSRVALTTTVSCTCWATAGTAAQATRTAMRFIATRGLSLDLRARGRHDLRPLLDLALDDLAEVIGAALQRRAAQLGQLRDH